MSLVGKIALSAGLPVVVLAAATGTSVRSIARADAGSRGTLGRLVPIVREAGEADELAAAAVRLHGRWMALHDPAYESLWATRMGQLDLRLRDLRLGLAGTVERRRLAKATRSFARYRAVASSERDGRIALVELGPHELHAAVQASARGRRSLASLIRDLEATADDLEARASAVLTDTLAMLGAAAGGAGVLAMLLSGWVASRVARALRRLVWASEALERGRLDEPVAIGGRDELALLGSALESLAEELRDRDRIGDELMRRLGADLDAPLRAIRDTTRALASSIADGTAEQRRLAAAIDDEAERLIARATGIGDVRRSVPQLPHAAPPALPFEAPALLVDLTHPERSS